MLSQIHYVAAISSLLVGGIALIMTKGSKRHVWLGRLYIASLLIVNVSGFGIYHLTSGFNAFHALGILNLTILLVAVMHILFRRRMRRWLWRHYQYMCWSYAALLCAACNEAFTRVNLLRRFVARSTSALPVIISATILLIAAAIIFLSQSTVLARYYVFENRQGGDAADSRN